MGEQTGREFQKNIAAIRATLEAARRDAARGIITKDYVNQYIDKIFVKPVDEHTMKLEIKIFTGETTEKYLQKLRQRAEAESTKNPAFATVCGSSDADGRMGHTSKIKWQKRGRKNVETGIEYVPGGQCTFIPGRDGSGGGRCHGWAHRRSGGVRAEQSG